MKNTPLNIISNGVESYGNNRDTDVDDMLILAMPKKQITPYKTPIMVNIKL
jgi:hypothetical protein